MKLLLVSLVFFVTPVSGFNSNNPDIIWNQSGDFAAGFEFFIGYEIADDFYADQDYTYNGLVIYCFFYTNSPDCGDMDFELYETDINTSPVYEFTVEESDITYHDTGLDYYGRDINLFEIPFPYDTALYSGNSYWTSFTINLNDDIFVLMTDDEFWERAIQNGTPTDYDTVMAMYGHTGLPGGIYSESIGVIKALFE